MDICRRIYPVSIPLSDTSITDVTCNYLDLGLRIEDSGSGSMSIVKLMILILRLSGMQLICTTYVPRSLGICVYYSQCVRMARICNFSDAFYM